METTRMTISISEELDEKIRNQADREHRNLSNMVQVALREYIERKSDADR